MPDLLTRHLLFEGLYQEDVVLALLGLIRPGDVVFDIGAHHGFMALVAAQKAGAVLAFEPNPHSLEHLRRNLALNGANNVTVMATALGGREGQVTLNIQRGTASWNTSLFREVIGGGYQIDQVQVPMTTVDAVVSRTGKTPVVMKIDVEGAEFLVLEGAARTLAEHRPALIMEFNPVAAKAAGTTIERLVGDLHKLGYELFALKRNRLGRFAFDRREPFNELRHCHDDLANVICLPAHRLEDGHSIR